VPPAAPTQYFHRTDFPSTPEPFIMRDLLPGGYLFTHLIFWTVVGMVAVGTNAVAIILSVGLGVLVLETVTKQR
jgi:hypothetical protein